MKAIITTPTDLKLSFVVWITRDTKIDEMPVIKVLDTPNKHLYIEYDENNNNLVKQCIDLDAIGLAHITDINEFEKLFPEPYYEFKKGE